MRTKLMSCLAIGSAVAIAIASPSIAQFPAPTSSPTIGNPLRVATRIVQPFVVEDRGKLTGFSIELWEKIAENLKIKYDLQTTKTVNELLDRINSKQADLGVAAISVTSDREKRFDFSQPIFDSGLQILVRNQGTQSPIGHILSSLFSPSMLQLFGIMLLIVLIPAHLVWFAEHKHDGGFLDPKSYFPGIFKSVWWAAATLATQAEEMPKGAWGRILAVLWMFTSVVFIAYFTATVTTSLTVEQLHSNIKGLDDLPGKRVATIAGSTSDNYLQQSKIEPVTYQQIEPAFAALENNQVDAVVFDSPILLYYAAHEGKGKVQVVGNIFRKEEYAIAMPNNSPLRKEINKALLSLQEQGTYQEIYDKWFK